VPYSLVEVSEVSEVLTAAKIRAMITVDSQLQVTF
jgi:hypothetical protein